MDGLPCFPPFHFLHLLQHFDPALHLPGFRRLVPETFDEFFSLFDLAPLVFNGGGLEGFLPFFRLEVGIVVAAVKGDLSSFDRRHLADHPIQKIPVVRNDDDRPGVVAQEPFQPDEGFQVEMIGGLVQEQEVGAGEENPAEGEAHEPPPAELLGGPLEIGFPKTEPQEDGLGLGFQRVSPPVRVFFLKLAVGAGQRFEDPGIFLLRDLILQEPHLAFQEGQVFHPALDFVEYGLASGRQGFLREKADLGPPADRDFAPVRLFLSGDHAEKGRLPRPVWANQPHPIPRPDAQGAGREEDLRAVSFFNVFDFDHGYNAIVLNFIKNN